MQAKIWTVPDAKRRKILSRLTGEGATTPLPPEITAPDGNGKFTPEGKVLRFAGNTFICHIDQQSAFYAALCNMQDDLKGMTHADHFSFLPKESFHMTMFCGVSGEPLGVDGWPHDVEPSSDLAGVTAAFEDRLVGAVGEQGFVVSATGLALPATIEMAGASYLDELKLRCVRAKLQELTGIVRWDIFDYGFHVSMAYPIKWLTPDDAEKVMVQAEALFVKHLGHFTEIGLGPIEFCTFETMHHFKTIGILDSHGYAALKA